MLKIKDKIKFLRDALKRHPLVFLMISAALVRLAAVIYSKGYLAHDDHFCVIEDASELIRTGSLRFLGESPHRSFFYPGLHYVIFKLFNAFDIYSPGIMMFFVRLLHVSFSLLTVFFGYKLTRQIAGKDAAFSAGLLLSFYFIMPFLAVRQLIEHVTSVFLVTGIYYGHLFTVKKKNGYIFISGLLLAIASVIRFQSAIFFLVVLIYIFFREKKKAAVLFFVSGILIMLMQGFLDLALFGNFLVTPINYIKFNLENATSYVTGPWYNYVLLIAAAFVPPFSFYMIWGVIKSFKLSRIIFYPTVAFFIMHSLFPGKQERFIFPIIPLIIIMGISGLWCWKNSPGNNFLKGKTFKWSWRIFWVINMLVLIPATLNYSQKARIAPLLYLNKKEEVSTIIIDKTEVSPMIPYFYLTKAPKIFSVKKEENFTGAIDYITSNHKKNDRHFVVMFTNDKLEKHLNMLKEQMPEATFKKEKLISPSLIDYILHKMNPRFNRAKVSWIYRVEID
ncbi:MAG: glycosyltransferase family 39 protein [Elusimicrobia bacterium]|jgi:hypothetical protein|nr:glycosyltransferase family 39 protein [Elusimicrobiota bacterium]